MSDNEKYEYTIKYFSIGTFFPNAEKHQPEIMEELNKLSDLGWELVNCMAINSGAYAQTDGIMAVLKRKNKKEE